MSSKQNPGQEGRQIIIDLGIEEHMEIFRANGIHVNVEYIGDPDYPALEVVHGLLFRRLTDKTDAPIAIAKKHEGQFEDLWRGGRGDMMLDCPVDVFAAWTRHNGSMVVFLDEEDQPLVEVAVPLAFYNESGSTIPETPVDGIVLWRYREGRKINGLFLPLDLEKANAEGWFSRDAAHAGVRTKIQMYPGIRRDRKTKKPRGVEPQGMHLSGLRIVSPLPPIIDWGDECEVYLTQRGRIIFAIPLPSVGTLAAIEAVNEAVSEGTDIDLGDGIEVGPEEVRYGKGNIRGIWDVLGSAHKTRGVEFDPIERTTSFADLKKAKRAVAMAIHPDKLEGRLKTIPGLKPEMIAASVKQAGLQWAPLCEAFDKALAVRDSQWEAVAKALAETRLDKEALAAASKADSGEDTITSAVGTALDEPFSWENPNHMGLRNKSLSTLRDRLKASEPPAPEPEADVKPPAEDPVAAAEPAPESAPIEPARPKVKAPARPRRTEATEAT